MAFVSWADEKIKVLDQISKLNDRLLNVSMGTAQRNSTKRSLKDLREHLEYIEQRAIVEARASQVGANSAVIKFGRPS